MTLFWWLFVNFEHISDLFLMFPLLILSKYMLSGIPAGIHLLKTNNRNIRTICEICSKLTIKTIERRQWRRSGVFIVNFEHISHLVLVFLLFTLNKYLPAGIWLFWKKCYIEKRYILEIFKLLKCETRLQTFVGYCQ